MKAARELVKSGQVGEATYDPPTLRGEVREGGKKYRAGLRIRSGTDIENLCTCRESSEWGKVCAHSLALGLAMLRPASATTATNSEVSAALGQTPGSSANGATSRNSPLQINSENPAATLHFILPPNFLGSWVRGKVMVCVEADLGGRRMMLDAAPPLSLDPRDVLLFEQLPYGMNSLSVAEFLRLLPILRGHPRITFGRGKAARVAEGLFRPRIVVKRSGEDFVITAQPNSLNGCLPLVAGEAAWVLRDGEFLEIGDNLPLGLTNVLREPLRLGPPRARHFLALELPVWREAIELELPDGFTLPTAISAEPEFALKLEGSLQHLRATLTWRYPENSAADPNQVLVPNPQAEAAATARLEATGFAHGELRDPARAARFFAFDYPALAKEWQVSVAPSLGKARAALEPVSPTIEIVSSGEDWFELRYSVASAGGEHIPLAEVQRLLRSRQIKRQLKNGRQAVFDPDALEDFEQLLLDANPRQHQPGVYRFDKAQAGYLAATAAETGARLIDAAHALLSETVALDLGSLDEKLRDYQRTGVAWLAALAGQKLGGILADEMGLGKTVQTLAFLQLRQGNGPALIVCPTSLLANWQREAAHFTPNLRVLVIDGGNRATKVAQLADTDLGLTSYGLLRRDVDLYRGLPFDTVVLDEAQHIKNPDTQNAQAAFNLRSRQRFVLTGTPMENSVRDLWSLMNFVVPGYLGSRSDFRERYEKPLAAGPEPALQRRLARRLRPFLLRRKKAEVAKELPGKIEQVVPCALGPNQRATYDALLREIQTGLGTAPNEGAKRMKMLTGLLRLRQACCDLRLLGLETPGSAKLDLLDELLEEIIDGGHRVLIFSQFVTMLDLVRQRLNTSRIAHCYLAGLTKDRQAQVDRFQNDAAIPVFLVSLKAGGVGLNLSAADTVIHFDPWWNAAVEAQATDRAHRIGQTRVVTAYKLIARETVEEKILELQNRKRELASSMLESDDTPLMTGLTTNDLTELLEA